MVQNFLFFFLPCFFSFDVAVVFFFLLKGTVDFHAIHLFWPMMALPQSLCSMDSALLGFALSLPLVVLLISSRCSGTHTHTLRQSCSHIHRYGDTHTDTRTVMNPPPTSMRKGQQKNRGL